MLESGSLTEANRQHARTFLLYGKELKIGKKKERERFPETGIPSEDSHKGLQGYSTCYLRFAARLIF
jgi:hypothetical protein